LLTNRVYILQTGLIGDVAIFGKAITKEQVIIIESNQSASLMKGFILPSFKVMSFAYGPLHTKDIAYVSMHHLVAALDFENISESTGRVNDISRCKTDATFVSPPWLSQFK
jgi:hypothetical protein